MFPVNFDFGYSSSGGSGLGSSSDLTSKAGSSLFFLKIDEAIISSREKSV